MWTAVEIDRPLRIVEPDARMEGENALLQRIDLGGDSHIGQAAHPVIGGMLTALVLADRGDPIRVVTVGAQPPRVVDRKAEIVAELGAGQPFGTILVINGRPLAREIDLLCEGRDRRRRDRERDDETRAVSLHGAARIPQS
jgi:hypothetical protein